MISLVLEKGYEAVTIKDIVARANVGRSTFYVHYDSKEGLLTSELTALRAMLTACQRTALAGQGGVADRALGFSGALFAHAETYRDIYRALVGDGGAAIVIGRMRGLLADLVRQDLSAIAPQDSRDAVPRSALVQFVVGALMSMLTWWTDRKSSLPPAEIDAMFRRMTIPAIAAALGETAPAIEARARRR